MKRSPKLRPGLWDILVVLLVTLLAAGSGFAVWGREAETKDMTVVISVDGEEVERRALAEFPDQERVYSNNGYTLRLALSGALHPDDTLGVMVKSSDCPTQDCVHTGAITRAGQSIVCLPARIIVQLEGGAVDGAGPDMVIG